VGVWGGARWFIHRLWRIVNIQYSSVITRHAKAVNTNKTLELTHPQTLTLPPFDHSKVPAQPVKSTYRNFKVYGKTMKKNSKNMPYGINYKQILNSLVVKPVRAVFDFLFNLAFFKTLCLCNFVPL
jgi:hypothetical protein